MTFIAFVEPLTSVKSTVSPSVTTIGPDTPVPRCSLPLIAKLQISVGGRSLETLVTWWRTSTLNFLTAPAGICGQPRVDRLELLEGDGLGGGRRRGRGAAARGGLGRSGSGGTRRGGLVVVDQHEHGEHDRQEGDQDREDEPDPQPFAAGAIALPVLGGDLDLDGGIFGELWACRTMLDADAPDDIGAFLHTDGSGTASAVRSFHARPMSQPALDEPRLRRLIDAGRGLLIAKVDVEAVLQQLLDVAREVTGARYAAVGVLDETRLELERFITAGVDEATHRRIGELPRGRGILGLLIEEPRPLRLERLGRASALVRVPGRAPEDGRVPRRPGR